MAFITGLLNKEGLLTAHEGNAATTQGHALQRKIFVRELEKKRAAAALGRNDEIDDDPDSDGSDGEWLYGSKARDNEVRAAAAAEGARVAGSGRAKARPRRTRRPRRASRRARRACEFAVAQALQRMTEEQQRADREAMLPTWRMRTLAASSTRRSST